MAEVVLGERKRRLRRFEVSLQLKLRGTRGIEIGAGGYFLFGKFPLAVECERRQLQFRFRLGDLRRLVAHLCDKTSIVEAVQYWIIPGFGNGYRTLARPLAVFIDFSVTGDSDHMPSSGQKLELHLQVVEKLLTAFSEIYPFFHPRRNRNRLCPHSVRIVPEVEIDFAELHLAFLRIEEDIVGIGAHPGVTHRTHVHKILAAVLHAEVAFAILATAVRKMRI